LAIAPADIQFTYGSHGKPHLHLSAESLSAERSPISFNLSHSDELALFAFCSEGLIGVDIEHLRPSTNVVALSKRFFTPREHQRICKASDRAVDEFFRLWTYKEAYLKATGEGLAKLQTVEIDVPQDGRQPSIVGYSQIEGESWSNDYQNHYQNDYQWAIAQLSLPPGYVGAIALGIQHNRQQHTPPPPSLLKIQNFIYSALQVC
jgi:4'-phosphopantetheinyl transferase